MARKIKSGDEVVIITGQNSGKRGRVMQLLPRKDSVLVEGVNMRKRHQKKTQDSEGGIIERESPVHISNVMLAEHFEARAKKREAAG